MLSIIHNIIRLLGKRLLTCNVSTNSEILRFYSFVWLLFQSFVACTLIVRCYHNGWRVANRSERKLKKCIDFNPNNPFGIISVSLWFISACVLLWYLSLRWWLCRRVKILLTSCVGAFVEWRHKLLIAPSWRSKRDDSKWPAFRPASSSSSSSSK